MARSPEPCWPRRRGPASGRGSPPGRSRPTRRRASQRWPWTGWPAGAPRPCPAQRAGSARRAASWLSSWGGRHRSLGAVREIAVFSGSAHLGLADEICAHLGVPLHQVRLTRFANDCLEVQLQSNCRERDVFLIQPLCAPVQEHLVELLLMLDAARGASAARVTAVIPHYAYARSDKKAMPRVSIGGRMVADLLVTAGASRILTMTLHAPQVHGFFSVPVATCMRSARSRGISAVRTSPTRSWSRQTSATPSRPRYSRGCWACRSPRAPRSGTATPA